MRYLPKRPTLSLEALGIILPTLHGEEAHPNRAPFRGVLTRLDEPSTRPPNGSTGKRTLIPTAVAGRALPSLLGMGVNVAFGLRDHDKQAKIGIITSADIVGQDLVVAGYLFAKDFPQEVAEIRAHRAFLGMSYELTNVEVDDPAADPWVLTGFTFTGAAILLKQAAAYQHTSISAAASGLRQEDQMSKLLDELKRISAQITALEGAGETAEATDGHDEEAEADPAASTDAAPQEAQADEDAEAEALVAAMEEHVAALQAKAQRAKALQAAKKPDTAARLMSVFMRAMSYPGGGFDSEHDDEVEDMALFKKLLQQHKAGMKASRNPVSPDMQDMQASMALLTDLVKRQTVLLTDLAQRRSGLSTDAGPAILSNGGPARRTMQAGGATEVWLAKFEADQQTATEGASPDIDAQLDAEGLKDARHRMARKLELAWNTTRKPTPERLPVQ